VLVNSQALRNVDHELTEMAYLHLQKEKPDFCLLSLQGADIAGVHFGFHSEAYRESVEMADQALGLLLENLAVVGLQQEYVIMVVGCHGGSRSRNGEEQQGGIRLPLIFAGPGVARGAKCHRPAELLDMYPTLAELCGLPAKAGLDGHSLVPQLKDANAPREWPAITTHNRGNHGIRTEKWRYIRYADGSEELYDVETDPHEWANLASDSKYADVKKDLAKHLPKNDAPPVAKSSGRIFTFDNGVPVWEGQPIGPKETLPED